METKHLPHYCHPGRRLFSINGLVIHFISDRFRHPEDPFNFDHIFNLLTEAKLSYHVIIPREGDPVETLPAHLEAWHAGYSRLNNIDYCNHFTHGIALVGKPGLEYTESQLIHLGQYTAQDMSENGYTSEWIAGHEDVRRNWNDRYPDKADKPKHDPGSLFPWGALREMIDGVNLANKLKG